MTSSRSENALAAIGLVAGVLRLDRLARRFPFGVAPMAQLVEIAARRQRLSAVHCDRLAGEPIAAVGHQERGEILQFFKAADAPHRIARGGGGAGPRGPR